MDRSISAIDIYTYPEQSWSSLDLSGFSVEATDGGIGSVDESTHEMGTGSIVVDTGPWIFGKKVMLPAGVISRIDENDHRIWVNLTKDQIQNAPEFNETRHNDPVYRDEVGSYYGSNRPAGPDYGRDDRGF
ncbi:MAG: PRC-barrel domain containing protein [Chloroflexi bacterium]|nr:PRC-barrel domain containing protein [Chloroflexota bacterium]MBA3740682.1 PRC-barrel domain containing protein [Chloroflexota bacterium]